jgi:PEP-CTERM motif
MQLIHPKFAATTCLFALLATPAAVFADRPGSGHDNGNKGGKKDGNKNWAVPEPSTLVMTLAGMGLVLGLAIVGRRRNRSRSVAA